MNFPREWKGFGPFLWHGFFLALTMAMFDLTTVLPAMISRLTDNPFAVGAVFSLLLGAPLLFNLPFSRIQNRFASRRPFLLAGIYLRSASFLGMAFVMLWWGASAPVTALIGISFFILVFSLGGGFAGLAYTELVGRLIDKSRRASFYATRQVFSGLASLAGGVFLVWLFRSGTLVFPWDYFAGLALGSAGLLLGALGFWRIRESKSALPDTTLTPGVPVPLSPKAAPAPKTSLWSVLKKDPSLRRFILVENLSGFGLMVLPFYMVYIQGKLEGASSWLGLFILAQTLGALFSNPVWAIIARKFGPRRVARLCMLTGGVLPLLALFFAPLGLGASVFLFVLIGFVISGRNIGFEPWLLEIAPADQRTTWLGIRGSLSVLLAFLPLAGGALIGLAGFEFTFLLAALMLVTGSFIPQERKVHP